MQISKDRIYCSFLGVSLVTFGLYVNIVTKRLMAKHNVKPKHGNVVPTVITEVCQIIFHLYFCMFVCVCV